MKSELGRGSEFSFILPYEEATSARSERTTRSLRMNNVENKDKKLILVAEDSDNNYELIKVVLNKQYNLIHAKDGIEAVTLNEEEHPDLILMDIRMPNMDGLDATKIIKEVNDETPIIALSAYAFEEDIKKTKMAGCDDFIAKPCCNHQPSDAIRPTHRSGSSPPCWRLEPPNYVTERIFQRPPELQMKPDEDMRGAQQVVHPRGRR